MRAYEPRDTTLLRVLRPGDWQLKLYSIALDGTVFDESRFAGGLEFALHALPSPARTPERPGVGFCILHQGRGADYVVVAWWDRENELPIRVFVKSVDDAEWRAARGSESVCVWDLEVIGFERNAYVSFVLTTSTQSIEQYMALSFE
jgi:hypothetical protein